MRVIKCSARTATAHKIKVARRASSDGIVANNLSSWIAMVPVAVLPLYTSTGVGPDGDALSFTVLGVEARPGALSA
jgi:hypothetical protein